MALNLPAAAPMPDARSAAELLGVYASPAARTLLAWAAFDWAVIGAGWTAIALLDGALVYVAGVVVVASRLHALGVILHDACHRRRGDDVRAWRLVEALAGWPIASTIEAMRYHHLRHHAASGTPRDPYYATVHASTAWLRYLLILRGVLLPAWWTLRAVVAPLALLAPALRNFYGRAFLQDRSGRDLREHLGVVACARADLAQLAAQAIVLGAAFAAGLPVVACYFVPWMLAGVLNARRVVYEHAWRPCERGSRSAAWETTHDRNPGPLANAILYPHNIGLHRTHHRYPTVSFVHLPRLADATRVQSPPRTPQT